MSIKEGEYFREAKYRAFGEFLTEGLNTWQEAVALGETADKPKELIDFITDEIKEMPNHIRNKMMMKIRKSAWDNKSILKYLYNYILCSKGLGENSRIKVINK